MPRRHSATEVYRDVERYWHTLRYLRPAQIAARLDLRARAAARRLRPSAARRRYAARAARAGLSYSRDPWRLRGTASDARGWLSPAAATRLEREVADTASGTFVFLNERRALGRPIDWHAREASQLWRYHLHYFDYLPDLVIADEAATALELMTDWTERVPMAEASTRDAWHPYVVSVRLVNWMVCLATLPHDLRPPDALIENLAWQTVFIRRNLESDVGGNHLLKNLKALAIAGGFWDGEGARRLREEFTAEFIRALRLQLRSDGGHYEQSPMYHGQVLGDAIELAASLRHAKTPAPELEALIVTMETFLRRVLHPDGDFVQFGDTAAGMVPEPAALLAAAGVLRSHAASGRLASRHALLLTSMAAPTVAPPPTATAVTLEEALAPDASGFVTLVTASAPGFLVADAGPVCPDDLPAHAHSDLFGFEVSVGGTRVVVDSGVSEYAAGPWREYFRSTRAHSTVMVDDIEQSECWGSFRVGRRSHVVDVRVENGPHVRGFSASHTGFDHLPRPVRHCRRFLVVAERCWLIVDDLLGEGAHTWTTFLHLHPEMAVRAAGESELLATRDNTTLGLSWFGMPLPRCVSGVQDPLQGWHAPAFGRVVPSPTLVATGSGQLPVRFGWLLVPGDDARQGFGIDVPDPGRLTVHLGAETYDINLDSHRRAGGQALSGGERRAGADHEILEGDR